MKKILVIETGGTFATTSVDCVRVLKGISSGEKSIYDYELVSQWAEHFHFTFVVIRPIYTLSENMTLEKLSILVQTMNGIDFSIYSGIIITHGTDTLAYTANLLGILFSNKQIPIVLVSSNHPLSLEKSNGIENFIGALKLIASQCAQGVFVVYQNHDKVSQVHLGTRIKQMNQVIDSYESFKNMIFGQIDGQQLVSYVHHCNPSIEEINSSQYFYHKEIELNKKVLLIYPYVGLRYDFFHITSDIDAIVCGVYHSGTVCAENSFPDQSIIHLIDRANKLNIPVFLGEISSLSDSYESFLNLSQEGIVYPVYDISLENLYMKALIGLELFDTVEEVYQYLNESNVFFEKVIL